MGNVQQLKPAHVPLSPERCELADAIKRKREIEARLARIAEASETPIVAPAQEAVERAQNVLARARELEPKRLVAEVTGDKADFGPSVERAEWLLEEAEADAARAKRTREAFTAQTREAERALETADRLVRDAVRKVVQSEGGGTKLLAQLHDARREVSRLHAILTFLDSRACLPPYWDSLRPIPLGGFDKDWHEAISALEADAAAPLPE